LAAAFPVVCLSKAAAAEKETASPPAFKHLKYRLIGPAAGGRVCRVAGVPGDPLVYYAATAAGGVWKSSDGGISWKPIMDSQPVSSIGSLAVAPSDPNVIYAGAGEANVRGDVVVGNGIYKSTDAGKTWKHVWKQEGQIGTLIVHPTNPDIAFAAVLGHIFGPNPERGIYRTTDGGKTWKQVLGKDANTGASDVCFDPSNPHIVFAGLWQARRLPWDMTSGGPGSGLYVSRDAGDTWKQLGGSGRPELTPEDRAGTGLPKGPWGKVGVAVAPSDGRRVYALIEADKGGLYRSDDGGDTWRAVNTEHTVRQRAFYYSTITVDPKNADVVWCPNVSLFRSIDGGKTIQPFRIRGHGDHHDLWIDPRNPRRMINGNDGGVVITTDAGESWYTPPLPISQFYHVAADNQIPYHVSGAMQDLGTAGGPSNSLAFGGIARSDWISVGGGESGFTVPDPTEPGAVYAGSYGGYITRYDPKTKQVYSISAYPHTAVGKGGDELRYRFQWTAPIMMSPHDPHVVYHAANVLFKTTDDGLHWTAISNDLTRNDKSKQKWSGGPITGDNTGVEIYCTIFALAESPKQKDLLWAGTDDGLLHVSRDGGKHWTNVTGKIAGLPEWGTVSCIEASPFDAGTAYVVVDNHRLDDMRPYLFKTSDYGQTWHKLAAKLPQDIHLHAVREDPKQKGLLYLGSDRGVSFSVDDGTTWQSLTLNLPPVPVHDLVVKDNDLVIATHGRSLWIFDDLTPIRALTPAIAAENVHLFPVQPAVRWRYHGGSFDRSAEANPPQGAVVHYYLKAKPKGEVTLNILDGKGTKVRTLSSKPEPGAESGGDTEGFRRRSGPRLLPTEAGINRAGWDLTYTGPTAITGAMAWPPPPTEGPLVKPGTYTAKLTVDGTSLTSPVVVQHDPRVQISETVYDEQLQLALALRDEVTKLSGMVKQIRSMKQQLGAKKELWKENPKAKELVKRGEALVGKLDGLEGKLHNPKAKIPYDLLGQRGGAQLYSQLNNLFYSVMESDMPPTQGVREQHAEQSRELTRLSSELKSLITGDLAKLNETAKRLDIPSIVVPAEKKDSKRDKEASSSSGAVQR
jgi:photosystem II stability/assembly factor-like uncharacterized protein